MDLRKTLLDNNGSHVLVEGSTSSSSVVSYEVR